jgi:hypothetical protein
VVPCLDLLIKNGLAERVEGEIVRYRITPRGEEALGHLQELEKLIVETGGGGGGVKRYAGIPGCRGFRRRRNESLLNYC